MSVAGNWIRWDNLVVHLMSSHPFNLKDRLWDIFYLFFGQVA